MENLRVVVALATRDNDYQVEQSASATEAAARLGIKIDIIYAGNDAVNQSQQLVKIVQERAERPDAIVVQPVGTTMSQVANAAVAAGIGWVVLNREVEYLTELRHTSKVPVFALSPDQEEVGRIQGKQLAALATDGNVLYIEGPSRSSAAQLRTKGLLATKPDKVELRMLKGDWSERSARNAVKSWQALSTSRQLRIQAVVAQNDAMAMGARKALVDLGEADREQWLKIPFTGCDGVTRTGQQWVRGGDLRATVIIPPVAGLALEMLLKSIRSGFMPPERTLCAPQSFPGIAEIAVKRS